MEGKIAQAEKEVEEGRTRMKQFAERVKSLEDDAKKALNDQKTAEVRFIFFSYFILFLFFNS